MKTKTGLLKQKAVKAATGAQAIAFMVGQSMTAQAKSVTIVDQEGADMGSIMGGVISFICSIAMYIGIGLLVFGLVQLYTSFKDENPDGKIKAISFCVVAVGLMTIKAILKQIGIIA